MMTERDISQIITIVVYIFSMGYAYYQIKKKKLVFSKGSWGTYNILKLILNIRSLYRHNIILVNWLLIIIFSGLMDVALLQQFALHQVSDKPMLFFIGAPGYVLTSIIIWRIFDNQNRQYKQIIEKQSSIIQLMRYNKEKLREQNDN